MSDETVVLVDHTGIAQALVAFQAEVGNVSKGKENTFFHSNYADLAAVKAEAQPFLTKHGLAVVQAPGYLVVGDKIYDTLLTKVVHAKSGEVEQSTLVLKPVKQDPQAQGSAITYARRYAFMALLGLVADDDDDGNAASAPAPKRSHQEVGKGNAEIIAAIAAVQNAAASSGWTGPQATAYFKEKYSEDSLVQSSNVKALNETAEYILANEAAAG